MLYYTASQLRREQSLLGAPRVLRSSKRTQGRAAQECQAALCCGRGRECGRRVRLD